MPKFLDLANKDKRVKALHKQLQKGAYHVDLGGIEKEADSLHLSRDVRSLKAEEILQKFQKKFIQAALQNQAYRSRLVEMKVKCFRLQAKLEEHLDAIRGYLAVKYPNALKQFKTIGDRKAAINSVLEEPIAMLRKLELKDAELEIYIKDIDQTGYALKNIMDAMAYNKDNKEIKF
jgi:hypothetical protein